MSDHNQKTRELIAGFNGLIGLRRTAITYHQRSLSTLCGPSNISAADIMAAHQKINDQINVLEREINLLAEIKQVFIKIFKEEI